MFSCPPGLENHNPVVDYFLQNVDKKHVFYFYYILSLLHESWYGLILKIGCAFQQRCHIKQSILVSTENREQKAGNYFFSRFKKWNNIIDGMFTTNNHRTSLGDNTMKIYFILFTYT